MTSENPGTYKPLKPMNEVLQALNDPEKNGNKFISPPVPKDSPAGRIQYAEELQRHADAQLLCIRERDEKFRERVEKLKEDFRRSTESIEECYRRAHKRIETIGELLRQETLEITAGLLERQNVKNYLKTAIFYGHELTFRENKGLLDSIITVKAPAATIHRIKQDLTDYING